VIVLDTHVWRWWVDGGSQLRPAQIEAIRASEDDVLGVSAISCWEIAKLVQLGRLQFAIPLRQWLEGAIRYPGIRLLELTPEIAIESDDRQARRWSPRSGS
jgi:PIN domain nuclease of toxin-antitoxin system